MGYRPSIGKYRNGVDGYRNARRACVVNRLLHRHDKSLPAGRESKSWQESHTAFVCLHHHAIHPRRHAYRGLELPRKRTLIHEAARYAD